MKKLIFVLFTLSFCGCKESQEGSGSGNVLENLTFALDTVLVDSKDKLFDLRRGLNRSSISEDKHNLFLFSPISNQIHQINLDKLEWEKDFDFEMEGPNGISEAVLSTQTLGDGTFLITAYNKLGIFSEDGTKLKDLSISSLPISSNLEELDYSIILTKDQKNLFSLPGVRFHGPRTFAKINLETFEIENFPIPEMDWIFDLKVGVSTHYMFDESMYLREFNNQILALTPSTSSFYRYDMETDSLSYHSFVHELSPVANDIKLKTIVDSDTEYQEEMVRFFKGISFGSPIWDEERQIYFRFAKKAKDMDDSFQITTSQVFMYAYDRDFKLIGEALLPGISKSPEYPFFKKGKLWSYVNVEDELGFAVMDFKF